MGEELDQELTWLVGNVVEVELIISIIECIVDGPFGGIDIKVILYEVGFVCFAETSQSDIPSVEGEGEGKA